MTQQDALSRTATVAMEALAAKHPRRNLWPAHNG
jgi:hypothetical protein